MTKQAKKSLDKAQNQQLKANELDLQMRFCKFTQDQRQAIANYLNAYNLAAWIYNEVIDDGCRVYIDLAMKYTMETQQLAQSMREVSDDSHEVDNLVNQINYGA